MTQGQALTVLKSGANVFLSGEPGSGKSHTVNEYVAWLRDSGVEPAITAATGIAATHVSGMTIHSWSGIGILERVTEADADRIAGKEHVARRVAKAKVLIIDEVSMLPAGLLDGVDLVCREIRRIDRPFGGLQVVLVGDFFQLPPVARKGSETSFCFESSAWHDLNLLTCYLSEQHRQADTEFLEVLSAIRRGEVEELHYERITSRSVSQAPSGSEVPKLYSHNVDVDRINNEELAKLASKGHRFVMQGTGAPLLIEGLKRGCLSPELLELKEGARVMFTKNSQTGRYVNGTLGTVSGFESSGFPIIKTSGGEFITAEPVEWQVEEHGKVRAAVSQVPLRLAYAMTVHKSQGQSLDAAAIDLSQAFEYGQGYVALSRVRTLAGLHLLGLNQRALEVHPQILERDKDFRAASEAVAETFAAMPGEEVEAMHKQFIKAIGGSWMEHKGKPRAKAVGKKSMDTRLTETLEAVRNADSLKAAAKARGLTESTIVKHLEDLAEAGKLLPSDFEHVAPKVADRKKIQLVAETVGDDRLAPIYNKLHGRYTYEAIRLARLLEQ